MNMISKEIDAVFEGGGIKGIALAGGASGAMSAGLRFHRVAGTSAGALVASLVAAGYDANELRDEICKVRWPTFLDPLPFTNIPVLGKQLSMFFNRGLYTGLQLQETWRHLLAKKRVRTFADLEEGALRVVATDLTHGIGVVMPDDLPRYGFDPSSFSVALAVRMSSTVPFIFKPVTLRDQNTGEEVFFADGAMTSKFPVQVLSGIVEHELVGFRLNDQSEAHPHMRIRGPVSLAAAVISAGIGARESLPRRCFDADYVVEIPTYRNSLDFNLNRHQAATMFDHGYDVAFDYFKNRVRPGTEVSNQ